MRITHRTLLALIVWLVAGGLVAWGPGHAGAISLGGFESGDFTGWTTAGDAVVVDDTFGSGPPAGSFQALLSTVNGADDADGFASFSVVNNAVSASALESFLGLSAGSLDALAGGSAVEGSAIRRSFSAKDGDVLSFAWNFLSDEPGANDLAFVVVDGAPLVLADSSTAFAGGSLTVFLDETGFQTGAAVFGTTGVHTIAVGVIDTTDAIGASGLLVDDVTLISQVPGPVPLVLVLAGVVGFAAAGRLRRPR